MTRQRENLIVLFENYGNALKYEEAALNSAGTASQKFAIYQNSLEAAQERITNAFEKFSQTLIDGGTIKGLSQIAEKGIDVLSTLAKIRPVLQGILQVLLVYKSLKVVGGLVQSQKALKLLKDRAKSVKDAFVNMKNVFKLTEKAQTLHTKATKAQEKAEKATTAANRARAKAEKAATLVTKGKITAEKAAELQQKATTKEEKAAKLQKEASTLAIQEETAMIEANTAALNIYTLALTAAVALIAVVIKTRQNQIQVAKEEAENSLENAKNYQQQTKQLKELSDSYLKLKKKQALTVEEEEEKKEILDQIIEVSEELGVINQERLNILRDQTQEYENQKKALTDISNMSFEKVNAAAQKSLDNAIAAIKKTADSKTADQILLNSLGMYKGVGFWGAATGGIRAISNNTFGQLKEILGKYGISIEAGQLRGRGLENLGQVERIVELYKIAQQAQEDFYNLSNEERERLRSGEDALEFFIQQYGESADVYIQATKQKADAMVSGLTELDKAIAAGSVKTKDDYEKLKTKLKQEAAKKYGIKEEELSDELIQAIEEYVNKYFPQFAKAEDEGTQKNTALKESFASLQKEMATVREAYSTLTSAIKEYNDSGYISVDTFEKLLSTYPEYLKYLFDENGHIQDNTDALKENIKIKIYSEALSSANDLIKKAEAGDLSMLTDAIRKDTDARKTNLEIQLKEIYTRIEAMNISKQQKQMLWEEVGYRLKLADATVASLNSTSSATSSEDKYAKAVKYAQQVLQDKIDALKKEKEAIQERNEETQKELDLMDKALAYAKDLANDRIKALEEEKNALKEKNDEKEKELELQQLEENLANAKRRKVRVYRQDIDKWVWESDESEVADAQKALDDFKLEQQTEAIDAEIEKWNEYIEKLGEVTTVYEEEQKKLAFEQMQQYITQGGVNSRNLKQLENFAKAYAEKQKQIADNTTDEIDKQINKYEELKDQWGQIKTDYENAENARIAAQLLGASAEEAILNGRLDTYEEFKKKYNAYLDGQADKASSTANSVSESFSRIIDIFNQMKDFDVENTITSDESKLWENWIKRFAGGKEIPLGKMSQGIEYLRQLNAQGKLISVEDIQAAVLSFLDGTYRGKNIASVGSGGGGGGVKRLKQYYASGTKSSARGIALTDENGLELRIPNKGNLRFLKEGTGVLPNNLTERVFAMASNPVSYARKVAESMSNKTVNNTSKHITIGNVSLPNVTNAQSFIKELEIITQNR